MGIWEMDKRGWERCGNGILAYGVVGYRMRCLKKVRRKGKEGGLWSAKLKLEKKEVKDFLILTMNTFRF